MEKKMVRSVHSVELDIVLTQFFFLMCYLFVLADLLSLFLMHYLLKFLSSVWGRPLLPLSSAEP